jgi:methionyl-tRNA synthetase
MLLSAGVPLPSTLFVHGYLTVEGRKISKSLGVVVDPFELVRRYGVDPVRYWLLREVPPTGDADYSDEKLERRYSADLANGLGNLLNRTANMVVRYRRGVVPAPGATEAVDQSLLDAAAGLAERIRRAMEQNCDPQAALAAIWAVVDEANRYVDVTAPWGLAKAERSGDPTAGSRLDTALHHLVEALRIIGEALRPFLTETSERMAAQLGIALSADWLAGLSWSDRTIGASVGTLQPLFPKLESA